MFVEIEDNVYLNPDKIVAVELITVSSEPYGETYQWVFYTDSPGEKSVFYGKMFDSREDALHWFDNVRYSIGKKN
ncbi:hypothetical protein GWK41_01765 [Persephonella atlantica]|uniref:Uncharacterized protein n=1 Tax=Persephonella atlantica TaxID=2699429 RepID=A0ABS1GG39_9AQUI|nr:hypothetical protein [Persephonella atlantica]MBK3331791.1 hypothetical protein [Persephonella atlantica]